MASTIQVRLDDDLKKKSDTFAPVTAEELLMKLETSRIHANQGQYRDADEVISDMRAKYGL